MCWRGTSGYSRRTRPFLASPAQPSPAGRWAGAPPRPRPRDIRCGTHPRAKTPPRMQSARKAAESAKPSESSLGGLSRRLNSFCCGLGQRALAEAERRSGSCATHGCSHAAPCNRRRGANTRGIVSGTLERSVPPRVGVSSERRTCHKRRTARISTVIVACTCDSGGPVPSDPGLPRPPPPSARSSPRMRNVRHTQESAAH
jgi:hypothetical protein